MATMSTAGARWLAQIGAVLPATRDDETPGYPTETATAPTRWPLTDLMSERSLIEWAMVCREVGVQCQ